MKISDIAISNIKGNLYRYIMYFLSNSFAVTVFFIFANFVYHPSINVNSIENKTAQTGVVNGLISCQVIIVIFSVLFVIYSTSIFLKSRGKEFGLLSLYGMTRRQIKKFVLIESTIISIFSIATGILTGVIFAKLFFMIMEVFLEINIPLNISLKALCLTSLVFFVLFEVINALMLLQIKNKEIVQQLKTSKIPKEIPEFSKIKSVLGVTLIAIGYGIAWFVPGMAVPLAMIPVILIVITGTYFLFTQFSISVANKILKNENILYKKTNLIAFSQMIFKLQDTAKVLFLASILGAFTFTATETIYSFFTEAPRLGSFNTPQDMAIVQRDETLNDIESIERVKEILLKNNIQLEGLHEVKGVMIQSDKKEYFAIANSDYNKLAKSLGRTLKKVNQGEVIYSSPHEDPFNSNSSVRTSNWEEVNLNVGNKVKNFKLKEEINGRIISSPNWGFIDTLVLNDEDFKQVFKEGAREDVVKYTGINLKRFQSSYAASLEIKDILGEKFEGNFYSKIIPYRETRNSFGLVLFIGFFIAFLFFIASGSIIYFKLFNEIKQDGVEYGILSKIGTTRKEINKIATKQIGIIFFLPFIVSTSHSFFALKSLSSLMGRNLFTNGIVVMMGYLVFQVIYFMAIRAIYLNRIKYS